jgi:hypothetical protein
MHTFREKTDLAKASSSPIVYSQNTNFSVQLENVQRSHTYEHIEVQDRPQHPESLKHTLYEIRQEVPNSNKTLANIVTATQFANDFIATMHGLYREVGDFVPPVSERKYQQVAEKIKLDAALFFQQYATENMQQAGRQADEVDVEGEAEDGFLGGNSVQGIPVGEPDIKSMDRKSRDTACDEHHTDNSNGEEDMFIKGKGKATSDTEYASGNLFFFLSPNSLTATPSASKGTGAAQKVYSEKELTWKGKLRLWYRKHVLHDVYPIQCTTAARFLTSTFNVAHHPPTRLHS